MRNISAVSNSISFKLKQLPFNMKKVQKREEAKQMIESFFKEISNKTPVEIKKIKRVAMKFKIPLKEHKKKYCKKCFTHFLLEYIRIKRNFLSQKCKQCGYLSKWKIK